MKIGIYTIHSCNNFGALLQAYALSTFLIKNGYDAELVNIMSKEAERSCHYIDKWDNLKSIANNLFSIFNPYIHKKVKNFTCFMDELPLSKRYYCNEDYTKNPIEYDLHLVGSDQVWNVEKGLDDKFYFLPFLKSDAVKASFASSFGNVIAAEKYEHEIKSLLKSFSKVSVREKDAEIFLNVKCGIKATNVLDPTFLLSKNDWDLISGSSPIIKGKYILYYGFDRNQECGDILKRVKKQLGLPLIGISVSTSSPYRFDRFYQEAGPIEFLNLIKNASLILTSSFHGVAFALNFRKEFIVINHGTRMSRMESLLSLFDMRNRIISKCDDLQEMFTHEIDYSSLNPIIDSKILDSQNQLFNTINNISNE